PITPILPAPSVIVAPSSEFPLTPVVASHGIRQRRAILIQPEEVISIGRLYRTHPGGPCKELIVKKLVRPLHSHRLALRYPSATMTSSIHSTRALVPSRADILPPRKRFKDSNSQEDSVKKDIDTNVLEDIKADATTVEVEEGVQNIHDHVIEIPLQRIEDIENAQRQLEAGQLIANGERASLSDRTRSLERENLKVRALFCIERDRVNSMRRHMALSQEEFRQNMSITRSGMTPKAIEELVNRRVEEALAAYEATRAANAVEAENQSQNGSDGDNGNGGNRNGENENGKNGNAKNGNEWFLRRKVELREMLENKRRLEVSQRDNHGQQPPSKRPNTEGQNVARAYADGNNERKPYNGPLPLYNKCKLHHKGPCGKCNKVGHLTWDSGNKNRVGEARGKEYVLGGGDANSDSNVVKGTFLLNNHYASMIFDSGADRNLVSITFSTLLDITPNTLDVSYAAELADRRISKTNIVLRGCTLGLLGHPFNVDLMPVELGSFDVIIDMDWLTNHHVVIVCDEKIMRIPYEDQVLIVQGDRGGKGEKYKLSIISCTNNQKYI
nr:hypothetical protein [Tanacetum cinerariifolium]